MKKALFIIVTALLVSHGSALAQSEAQKAVFGKYAEAFSAGRYDEASLWASPELGRILTADQVRDLAPQQTLAIMEADQRNRPGSMAAYLSLPHLAKAAFAAGDFAKAQTYGQAALNQSPQFKEIYRGAAVYYGNQVLGRILLRKGDVAGARERLLASAETSGDPVLRSFGPNMMLARELLQIGERDAVLHFLSRCETSFWKTGAGLIEAWEDAIRNGTMPKFGDNLAR